MPNQKIDPVKLKAQVEKAGGLWEPGVTAVSQLPSEEKILLLGYTPGPDEPSLTERVALAKANYAAGAAMVAAGAPASYDLRNVNGKNFITSVKHQGSCGSCVAFGTIATVEGTLRVLRNDANLAVDYSEAHLFYCHARSVGRNCGYNNDPAGGWWVGSSNGSMEAFKTKGVVDDPCYPYVAADQACTGLCANAPSRLTKITGWHQITNVADMKTWLSTKGPLVACFSVYDDFYSYHSGIYHHVTGGLLGGHCISVVGYNDAQQYWICKNSWGVGFGESGFFRIRYGDCGLDAVMWAAEGVTPPSSTTTKVPLYRYWNPGIGDHFYTTNWAELGAGKYGWGYEGIQCYVANAAGAGLVPLYRYWNPAAGDHFYTTDWSELGAGKYGWGYEGIQCYVRTTATAGTSPLYRYWNPGNADHFYTTNWAELGSGKYGYGFERIQCYVFLSAASLAAPEEAAGEGNAAGEEDVPSTFSTQGGEAFGTSSSFTTSAGGGDSPPSGGESFTTMDASNSFQVTEEKKAGGHRVTITIDTE
jgi:C1A family cysteine protease